LQIISENLANLTPSELANVRERRGGGAVSIYGYISFADCK